MLPKRSVKLTEKEESELREGYLHGDNPVFRKHCHALLLSNQGKSVYEIMSILEVSQRKSVYDWFDRWNAAGIEGLHIKKGRGRKPKLRVEDEALVKKVKELLEKDAKKLSYIKSEIEESLGLKLNQETLRRFLKNLTTAGVAFVKACASSKTKRTTKRN